MTPLCRIALIVLACLPAAPALLHAGEDADFRKAHGYYTLQEYKLAADSFDKYLNEFPKSERGDMARLLLAESRYQMKQYPEAAASYDRFLADYPASTRRPEALLRATKVHFLLKQHEKSLSAAETFLKEGRPKLGKPDAHPALPAQIADALYYAGENCYALKNPAKAKTYWDELVTAHPESKLIADASEGLGWLHFDAKEFDQALARFKVTAAIPNHPRAAWAKLMEGRALAALKKYDDALAAFKAAEALPNGKEIAPEAALRTAEALLAAERYPAMLDAYKRLAKEFPNAPSTLPALANAAFQCTELQHQAESLALADLYLSIPPGGPDKPAVQRLKARALGTLADGPEAIKAARKGVDDAAALADPKRKAEEHPAALMLLAELTGAQGADSYMEVVKLYPETRFGLAARYELARLAGQGGKNDEALKHVQALLEQFAKQPDPQLLPELRRDALFAAAEFAFRKPDYKTSEEYLLKYQQLAGEADPRADDVARKLAWCRHESGDFAGAAKILDSALKSWPTSQYRDEMLYLRALAASRSDAVEDALKFNEILVTETPASPFADDALYDSAAILYKQNRFDPAVKKLTALLDGKEYAASPLRTAAYHLRASARLQDGKNTDALADAETLLQKNDDAIKDRLPALRFIKALALLAQPGKEAEGEAALSELIKAGPQSAPEVRQALLRRAYLRFEARKFKEAQEDFSALAAGNADQKSPESIDAALRMALCHKELKETAQAKTILEQLLLNKLEGIAAFEVPFQLGNIAFEAGDFAAARSHYERALGAAASVKDLPLAARSAANLNLAWSLRRLNDLQKAEQAFAEVVKADPSGNFAAEALYERGRLLDELNKLDDALLCWKELLEKKPDSPQAEKALFLRSQKLAKAGRFPDAMAGFEEYLKKHAAGPSAREAHCGLAESRMQAGNAAGARESFMKALGDKGADAELDDVAERALLGLAELSLKQGDGLAGKKLALRILTESTNSAWRDAAFYLAGQCSEQLGEPEKAIGYYRKLLADYPKSLHATSASERLKALGAPQ